jgi:hypothetical protein
VVEAVREEVGAERMYVMTLGSNQGNAHVHWHVVPLPPGVCYEEQQFAALMLERAGALRIPEEETGRTCRAHSWEGRTDLPGLVAYELPRTSNRRSSQNTLPGCEYPGEWLWATPRTGLPLLLGEPKVPCKCHVDRTPWCRPTASPRPERRDLIGVRR